MRIRDIMTKDPEACLASASCAEAIEIMRRRKCGFVPIVDSHASRRVIGVVTDRDIVLHLGHTDRSASQIAVEACMTREVKTVLPDADLEDAARVMEAAAVHRVTVVESGTLVGVLSIKNIALAARQQWAYAGPHVAERQMTEIIEAIAAAR